MRILLVHPSFCLGSNGFGMPARTEPLALEILAATVPEHEVRILDLRLDPDLEDALERFGPDLVGVTALTTEVAAAKRVMQTVKRWAPEAFTVVGGHHATLLPEDFQHRFVDAIGLGEGELVFPDLVRALATDRRLEAVPNLIWADDDGRFQHNGRHIPQFNADELPLPRRDLTAAYRSEYFFLFEQPDTAVVTGRGCPFRCNFCSVWQFYEGKTRQMSAPRVVAELQTIDTDHVTFVDDNFLLNPRREREIAQRIAAEGIQMRYSMECRTDSIVRHPELVEQWAKIGLYGVLLGLEGSDEMLRAVGKRNSAQTNDEAIRILQANGVVVWGAFIVDPNWEADDFRRLHDYVLEKRIVHTQFTVLTPLPGTDLYRDRRHELLTDDYTFYDNLHAVVPTRLPREEFYRRFADLYRQLSPEPAIDLVRQGKLTMAQLKRGNKMLKTMSDWEFYAATDPVLGRERTLRIDGTSTHAAPVTLHLPAAMRRPADVLS